MWLGEGSAIPNLGQGDVLAPTPYWRTDEPKTETHTQIVNCRDNLTMHETLGIQWGDSGRCAMVWCGLADRKRSYSGGLQGSDGVAICTRVSHLARKRLYGIPGWASTVSQYPVWCRIPGRRVSFRDRSVPSCVLQPFVIKDIVMSRRVALARAR